MKPILLLLKKKINIELHVSDHNGNSKEWALGRCVFSLPLSVPPRSSGRGTIIKKRSVSKKMLLKTPVMFPKTLMHINICAIRMQRLSV